MKKRKILAVLLALVMVLGMTACGGGSNDGDDPVKVVDEDSSWWEGDWYGWWTVFDGDGYYYDYIDESYDCCAYIEPKDGAHLLTIWDEYMNDYSDESLAKVMIEIDLDDNVAESVYTIGNYFWDGAVDTGEWYIDPEYAGVDNMIIIEGSYVDEYGDYCEYGVVLTKWGYEWNEDDSTYPPYYYESYFLPLMEDGESLPVVFEPY